VGGIAALLIDKRDRNLIHLYLPGIGTGLGVEDAGFEG
jgi:hypothetical protein